jgi:nicotinate-nucleotide adenylyltransferase
VRIGVFGGTFDPPHIGHLLVANDAREALELDRLIFVPTGAQPFKVDTPPVASGQDRLEMVRLAVADDANYVVDDAEINRKGLSFTVDTLEHLSERNPAARLFLLMGEDVLAGFEKWRSPGRIRELATLVAVSRSGLTGSVADPATAAVLRVSSRRVDVSSTEIRQRRRAGKSIKGFVPESVERFIDVRGLYR